MAQLHYEAYHAPQNAPHYQAHPGAGDGGSRVGRLVNLAGAALSVALLAGVGVWSYRLMVRDVTGVPVIRALEGPIRVSPADPGGRQEAYQGLAVNTVAAEGGAAGAAQTIALAPPPISLSAEDRAVAELVAQRAQPIIAPITAPPPAMPAPAAPVAQQPIAAPAVAMAEAEPLTLIDPSVPGVNASPLPRRRPGSVLASAAGARARAAAPGTDAQAEAVLQELVTRLSPSLNVTEIDPSTLAPGTRLVQLGAYDSEAEARAEWEALAARFPAYLDGRGRIIEAASAGGRTFYRLRAHGFTDEPEARRFCSVFLAENVDCIPVLIR
ncbi:MAG: SPOR domain-containing protein [Pararhodobacter sp.]